MPSRELLSLSLYSLLASNRGGLFIVFLPLYLVEVKGASLPVALTILTLAWAPTSLIGPWVGRLSDRVGRRKPFLLIGEAAAFPLFLAIVWAPGYVVAGVLFIAAELALAIGSPPTTRSWRTSRGPMRGEKGTASSTPPRTRERSSGSCSPAS